MKVDQYIGLNELLVNDIEKALVQQKLFIGQVYFCKKQALGKKIVGDGYALKKVLGVDQLFELLIPFCHKKQFQRKGILLRVFVKPGKKRIVCELFQYKPCVKMPRQEVSQSCFACTYIAFNGNEMVFHKESET